ncbi:unnamed protein product, partial [Effrenium voratum]
VLALTVPARHWLKSTPAECEPASSPRRIIIDTDPGVDDALAILLALGCPELQVEALSIAMGNGKDIRALGSNAKLLLRLANAETVPVSLGAQPEGDVSEGATVKRRGMKEQLVHGADHMGNVGVKYGKRDADYSGFHQLPAPELIYDVCKRHPGEVTLVCIASLHNVASALQEHPDLPELVREVVIMGGAFGERRGNRTPSAEANFFDGPEAAQAVLTAGFRRVVLAGLDITHQTDMLPLRKACKESSLPLSQFIWDLCENFITVYHDWGETLAPAHDAVPIMYLVHPDLFEGEEVRVEVETAGVITKGMSIADWKGQWGKPPNCLLLRQIRDQPAFYRAFVGAMQRLPRPSS